MADASGPSGGGYDYVQDSTNSPTNPKLGEEWYQPDTDDVQTYDGGTWVDVKISDHAQLSGVSAGDHFSPGGGLSFSAGALELLLSGYLELDGNGDLAISAGSVTEDRLAFSTATQSELDGHTGDSSAHHTPAYSETDNGSDVTPYTVNADTSSGTTIVDITGSGVLLDGWAMCEGDHRDSTAFTITVDGGSSWTVPYCAGNLNSAGYNSHSSIGAVRFSTSLQVTTNNPSNAEHQAVVTVKQ